MRFLLSVALWLAFSVHVVAQTNIFTLALSSSNSGNNGYSFRQQLLTTGQSQGKISVTFQAGSAGGLKTDHASICIQSSVGNCNAAFNSGTFQELTFSGGHGFSIGSANGQIASDYVTFTASSGTSFVVIIDINASGPSDCTLTTLTGYNSYYNGASASYNVQSPSYSNVNSNQDSYVTAVNTESGSGAIPHNILLLGQ